MANIENLNPQPLDVTVSNGDMQSDTLALTVAWSVSPSRGVKSSCRLVRRSVTCWRGIQEVKTRVCGQRPRL